MKDDVEQNCGMQHLSFRRQTSTDRDGLLVQSMSRGSQVRLALKYQEYIVFRMVHRGSFQCLVPEEIDVCGTRCVKGYTSGGGSLLLQEAPIVALQRQCSPHENTNGDCCGSHKTVSAYMMWHTASTATLTTIGQDANPSRKLGQPSGNMAVLTAL